MVVTIGLSCLVIIAIKWLIIWIAQGHFITKAIPSFKEVLSLKFPEAGLNIGIIGMGLFFSTLIHESYTIMFFGVLIMIVTTAFEMVRHNVDLSGGLPELRFEAVSVEEKIRKREA